MPVTPKALLDGTLLTASSTTLYTAPASTTAVIRSITLCNTDTVARTVTIYIVQSGGSIGDDKKIFDEFSLAAGETIVDDTLRVLETGDTLRGLASTASVVSIRADGSEVT